MNQLDFTGRTAIVTGGARGIGYGIAQRLGQSGARVMLWDRDSAAVRRAGETLGVEALSVDVADADAVSQAARESAERLGGIHVLVNSAGITGPNVKTWEYDPKDWRGVMAVNLDGTFHCCRAVVPYMAEQGYGRIVNIASIAGKEGNPNACAYSASKGGVIALTKSLGKELADKPITVNCITPAAVRTEIFDQMTQAHIDYMLSKIPMGRFGQVEEIAALAAWLCSEECSFSTGAVFDASGGRATY